MRSPGYLRIDRTGEQRGRVEEYDTRHCCHCNALIPTETRFEGSLLKKQYRGSWCSHCGALKCARVGCQPCVSFMTIVDRKHAAERFAAAAGLVEA